jgi:predicted enzyme related to lactoylglutathione lyase
MHSSESAQVSDPVSARIAQVIYPVGDVGAAVGFYTAAFGFIEKFVDGQRYAALDGGGTTFALAAPEEDVAGSAAAAVKVEDVRACLGRIVDAGGEVLRPAEEGPHEIRAVVRDPWGNVVIVYASR